MRFTTPLAAAAALALAIEAAPVHAQDGGAAGDAALTLTVSGIAPLEGAVRIALFQGAAAFDDGGEAVAARAPEATADTVTVSFDGLAPGAYGIKIHHDVDGEGDFDTNMFGIPTEPYAFSNNAKGRMGPAKFEAAGFEVVAGENAHAVDMGG